MPSSSDPTAFWDRLARRDPLLATEGYNACPGYRSREEIGTLRSAAAWFRPVAGDRVLDLGCGWGKMAGALHAAGIEVVGVDASHAMLGACRRDSRVERLVQARAGDPLPFADRSFDHVWSHSMLMHLPRHALPGLLAEVARVLRPGGTACLHVKNRRHPSELLLAAWGAVKGGTRHPHRRRGTDPGWLARLARRHFGQVELAAESFQLIPLSLPVAEPGEPELGLLGIPGSRAPHFRHLLPAGPARGLRRLADVLRDRANRPGSPLVRYGKELLMICREPRR